MLIHEIILEDVQVAADVQSAVKDHLIVLRDSGTDRISTRKFLNMLRDEGYRLRMETLLKILVDIKDTGADYLGSANDREISLGMPADLLRTDNAQEERDVGDMAGRAALKSIKK